ncbi:MAG: helix-turn-helix domain-containing protein [Oscillospiraceae bacterium]
MDDMNKRSGSFIAQRRKQAGLTQLQLAERIGVSDKAVSKWETGRGFPDVSVLEGLAEALGVSISEIVTGKSAEQSAQSQKRAALRLVCIISGLLGIALSFAAEIIYCFDFSADGIVVTYLSMAAISAAQILLTVWVFGMLCPKIFCRRRWIITAASALLSALLFSGLLFLHLCQNISADVPLGSAVGFCLMPFAFSGIVFVCTLLVKGRVNI